VLQPINSTFGYADLVALVTHGGLANALLHAIVKISPIAPQWFELANSSISHVRLVHDP
jgi:broad specificity phosphatase PhoE